MWLHCYLKGLQWLEISEISNSAYNFPVVYIPVLVMTYNVVAISTIAFTLLYFEKVLLYTCSGV